MRMLGVDPGQTGALALLEMRHNTVVSLQIADMPVIGKEVQSAILADLVALLRPDAAYVEQVHSMPKQGVASTFTFGCGYGMVRGVLAARGVPTTLIVPQRWGSLVKLAKSDSRARAVSLFPAQAHYFTRAKDHGRADAALIALAGVRDSSPF